MELIELTVDQLQGLIKDDPVRPHIPAENRMLIGRSVALKKDNNILAVCCYSFSFGVPKTEDDLLNAYQNSSSDVFIVPYTIWSYKVGAGRMLLVELLNWIKKDSIMHCEKYPRVVTLSPKTEDAKRFHTHNGAFLLSINDKSYNYEYVLNDL